MPKDFALQTRVSEATHRAATTLAKAKGITTSALLNELLTEAFKKADVDAMQRAVDEEHSEKLIALNILRELQAEDSAT